MVAALRDLMRLSSRLSEMVVPGVPASGTNAGRGQRAPGPREPVRGHPFAVEHECWLLLQQIIRAVCRASVVAPPRHRRPGPIPVGELAAWLLEHVEELAGHEQAVDAAVVICQQARRVSDLVDPPPPGKAPAPGVDGPRASQAPGVTDAPAPDRAPGAGKWGTPAVVAEGAAVLERKVSASAVKKWAQSGCIRALKNPATGAWSCSLEDVVAMVDSMAARLAEHRRVGGGL